MLQAVADGWTQDQLLARPPLREREDIALSRGPLVGYRGDLSPDRNPKLVHVAHGTIVRDGANTSTSCLMVWVTMAQQDILKADLEERLRSATTRFLEYIAEYPRRCGLHTKAIIHVFRGSEPRGWILLAALHDADHRQQIQRIADERHSPSWPGSLHSTIRRYATG